MNVSEHFEHSIVVAWQPLHLKPQLKVNEGVIWVMLNYAIKPNHFPLSFIMQDHVTRKLQGKLEKMKVQEWPRFRSRDNSKAKTERE